MGLRPLPQPGAAGVAALGVDGEETPLVWLHERADARPCCPVFTSRAAGHTRAADSHTPGCPGRSSPD